MINEDRPSRRTSHGNLLIENAPRELHFPTLESRDRYITELTELVETNLKLERGLPEIAADKRKDVALLIARTIVDSCIDLNVPLPQVRLTYQWHEKRMLQLYENNLAHYDPHRHAVAFSPVFLRRIIDWGFGGIMLRAVTRHEMYHAWQEINLHAVMNQEVEEIEHIRHINDDDYEDLKESRRSEIAARLYELRMAQADKVGSVKEFIQKTIMLFVWRLEVIEVLNFRKKHRTSLVQKYSNPSAAMSPTSSKSD